MLYPDQPIKSSGEDKLNRRNFAKVLAKTLVGLSGSDTFTVGLFGNWGCGKTSLINMTLCEIKNLEDELKSSRETTVIQFEPWNFTDSNQLLTQFLIRLTNEFRGKSNNTLKKIGKALEDYSDAFGLLELIPGVGTPIATIGKITSSQIGENLQNRFENRDILKQKENVIQLLQEQPERILVVIDDIDRLNNEQIRCVFQLITSVARFPNITYLLAFDREIVVEALKYVQNGNGYDYLEKVIQIPIQIPDIQRSDLRKILSDNLNSIASEFKDLHFRQNRWQHMYNSCIEPFITHLRDINRLCNELRFMLVGMHAEIDFIDMVAITALEIKHPQIYEWIKKNKPILTGEGDYSDLAVEKTGKEWLLECTDHFGQAILNERSNATKSIGGDAIARALATLFPYFGVKVGLTYDYYENIELIRDNRIAHPNRFDRYFQLDISAIAFTSADIDHILHGLSEDEIVDFLLKQGKQDTCYELLGDIKAFLSNLPSERAKVLIRALMNSIDGLTQQMRKVLFSAGVSSRAAHMMLDLLAQIPNEDRVPFIIELITNSDSQALQPIANFITMLESSHDRVIIKEQLRKYRSLVSVDDLPIIEREFFKHINSVLHSNSLFGFSNWYTICRLMNYIDPEYTKKYLECALQQDENVLQFLAHYVDSWYGVGIEYEIVEDYLKHISKEQVLNSIQAYRQNRMFFDLPEDLQHKCAAFVLASSGDSKYEGHILQSDTQKLIDSWFAQQ